GFGWFFVEMFVIFIAFRVFHLGLLVGDKNLGEDHRSVFLNGGTQGEITSLRTSRRSRVLLCRLTGTLVFIGFCVLAGSRHVAAAEDVVRATLGNGLKVVVVKNPLAPVATTMVNYIVGADETPEGFPGMAHAQEHMMFRGSPSLSADQLSALIAAFGGEFNADTQQTVTQYFFTVPAEDLNTALRIEAIRMRAVLDSPQLWKKERGAINQEVAQDLSNPEYVLYTRIISQMFEGTPYAHDALGTRPSFDKTTSEMLRRFHRQWYGPNNAILVIAGDVDPNMTLRTVDELFGNIPARPTPSRPSIHLAPLKPAVIKMDTDQAEGQALVCFRLPGLRSPDYAAAVVLADVLDSQRSRLFTLVTEGKALDVDFSLSPLPEASLGSLSASFPQGADGDALVDALKSLVVGYLKDGVPADLVEAAKQHEIADAEFRKNSVSGLASLWSQALAVEGRDSPDDDIEAIRRVTPEDVTRVARKYLVVETALVGILTPQPSGTPSVRREAGAPESFAPSRTKSVALPGWARKTVRRPALPSWEVNPDVTTLPNGLKIIFVHETVSDTVSVFGRVKNNQDLEAPEGKEGVSEVLNSLFLYGSATLDRLSFQKALDDISARESAGTDFSLQVISSGFERGMELLADNLLRPALPEEAFRVVQKETSESLKGRLESPSYLVHRALRKGLYPPGDPSLREATPKSVLSLSLDDVRSYHKRVFRPDMTTIVIVGDLTREQATKVVERYFAAWSAEGPRPETDLPPVPPNKPSAVAVIDRSRVQTEVTLAETVGITRHDPDYYVLEVGRHVLSGAFYATRFYRDLREKTGLVYSVEAVLEAGKTRSLFGVVYACDPGNVSRARAIVERDLRDMQKRDITSVELNRSKTLLIRRISLSRASTHALATLLLQLAVQGLPLDEPVIAAKKYLQTEARDVRRSFARWISPSDFVQITLEPE
ncbi:MAG: pitrilysin family protein, partial [Thermodesulfovibrionales bacterium]